MAKGSKVSRHHLWWPKWRFLDRPELRRVVVWVNRDKHARYHKFFLANCRDILNRKCRRDYCEFCAICLYCHPSNDNF